MTSQPTPAVLCRRTARFTLLLAVILTVSASALAPAARAEPDGPTARVLVVGDSWADLFWDNRSLRDAFAAHGFPQFVEKGDVTAISGSTAAEWATPSMLQLITDELDANTSIDTVQLTVGGNDFLAGMSGGGWYVGIPPAELEALFARVQADIETVVDHVLAYDPSMEVVLSLYDYANFDETLTGPLFFICVPLWQDLGMPTPLELNTTEADLELRIATFVDSKPRTEMVLHSGWMQFTYGFPSMGIPPGSLLPPGDLDLPSPIEAMRLQADCFHLRADGYAVLAENLWQGYYAARFQRLFGDGFESGDTSAWSQTAP